MPLIVLSVFIGLLTMQAHHTQAITPSVQAERSELDGHAFLAYRDAVHSFVQGNPGFTGSIPSSNFSGKFPAHFLQNAAHHVSATSSGSGRIITCYATLSEGALHAARLASDNDASLGVSSGTHWVSVVDATHAEPLVIAIPNGNAVSVIQIGG